MMRKKISQKIVNERTSNSGPLIAYVKKSIVLFFSQIVMKLIILYCSINPLNRLKQVDKLVLIINQSINHRFV